MQISEKPKKLPKVQLCSQWLKIKINAALMWHSRGANAAFMRHSCGTRAKVHFRISHFQPIYQKLEKWYELFQLTLFQSGGWGLQQPKAWEIGRHSGTRRGKEFSFGEFLSWSLYQPWVKPFLKFILWNFVKPDRENFWSASFLGQKWEKWIFSYFLQSNPIFFVMNLNST